MPTMQARPATTDYKIWAEVRTFSEEASAMHVVAEFRFLQEALDYVRYANKLGSNVVLTGPYGIASRKIRTGRIGETNVYKTAL